MRQRRAVVVVSVGLFLLTTATAVQPPSQSSILSDSQITTHNERRQRLLRYFPQASRCSSDVWVQDYAQLHAQLLAGAADGSPTARLHVHLARETGTADRLVGLVSQFYLAALGGRAFTAYVPQRDIVPGFEATCDFPYFNWTHPSQLDDRLWKGLVNHPLPGMKTTTTRVAPFPPPHSPTHLSLNWYNADSDWLDWLRFANLTRFPGEAPDVPHIVASSNRGVTWKLLHNPRHRDQFLAMGLTAEDAFMCGFFALCQPSAALEAMYAERFWAPLRDASALRIGIQIRFGDATMTHDSPDQLSTLLQRAQRFFECAERIEEAFALPGQRAVWYLLSDSGVLRRAARDVFGPKLLTDTDVNGWLHTDCKRNPDASACTSGAMGQALRHAVGSMLAFSLADYHVVSLHSGFGRAGAWLSGRRNNIYEVDARAGWEQQSACDPLRPTSHAESARHWSGI